MIGTPAAIARFARTAGFVPRFWQNSILKMLASMVNEGGTPWPLLLATSENRFFVGR
jgi:hypothetical protein